MCGICGYVGDHRPELLEAMCAAMTHRGPDDQGTWCDAGRRVGLGLRRLSIIDLSPAGHQPMSNEDGTVWISYNGEVYNYQAHYERLAASGHKFRGRSDTEVLVHLYEEMGPDFVAELNGMFALAIWDSRRDLLLLARDHAGVKPLYYWQDGERLYFASEIRGLLRIPELPRRLNAAAVPLFLSLLYVPGEETMLQAVRKVEPGCCLIWEKGRIEQKQWFTLAYAPDEGPREEEWIERVRETMVNVTRRQMVSDVPLGAYLSGGLDSSAIVACMRHCFPDREINCYTYYYDDADEARDQFEQDYPYARQVARHLRVGLRGFRLKSDASQVPRMIYHVEEPDVCTGVFANYEICKLAREDGTTVLLSGMGGDEVFFGYRSYLALRLLEQLDRLPRWLLPPMFGAASSITALLWGASGAIPRRLRKFRETLLSDGLQRHLALSQWSSGEVRQALYGDEFAAELARSDNVNPLKKYFENFVGRGEMNRRSHVLVPTFLGAHNFLYADKSSMAVSVEVRVPFMDVELLRLCARIPERHKLKGRTTKHLLKEAMRRFLPRVILERSGKTGFGAPLRQWVVEGLDPMVRECLSLDVVRARGLFDAGAVERLAAENRANKADHGYLICALLTLELWMRMYLDRPGEAITI